MSPLVEHGTQLQGIQARYPASVATLQAIDARTAATLAATPANAAAITSAVTELDQPGILVGGPGPASPSPLGSSPD